MLVDIYHDHLPPVYLPIDVSGRRNGLKISPVCSKAKTENSPIHSHDCLRFIANKSPVYILQILPW